MRLDFLGHAAFLLESASGLRVLIDPYESGGFGGRVGYRPITEVVDVVVITHDHLDHSHTATLPGPFTVIRHAGELRGMRVRSVQAFHDAVGGARFGGTVDMKVIELDGLRVCHAGDLGQDLTPSHLDALGEIDVFIPPVGGFYTLDADGAARATRALAPSVVVPCHYKTPACGFDIAALEPFLEHFDRVERPGTSHIDLDASDLPVSTTCVVLEPRLG
jgi:L-ascorbate metabolism protein UlaG (beta-lactamase superfamily)